MAVGKNSNSDLSTLFRKNGEKKFQIKKYFFCCTFDFQPIIFFCSGKKNATRRRSEIDVLYRPRLTLLVHYYNENFHTIPPICRSAAKPFSLLYFLLIKIFIRKFILQLFHMVLHLVRANAPSFSVFFFPTTFFYYYFILFYYICNVCSYSFAFNIII